MNHQPFVAAIQAVPDDNLPKLIYADWLSENGQDDLAFAYRWAVAKRKTPKSPKSTDAPWMNGVWCWEWTQRLTPRPYYLPAVLEQPMRQGRFEHTRHDSYEDAMKALAAALAELRKTLDIGA